MGVSRAPNVFIPVQLQFAFVGQHYTAHLDCFGLVGVCGPLGNVTPVVNDQVAVGLHAQAITI